MQIWIKFCNINESINSFYRWIFKAIAIICNIDNILISWVSAIIYSLYIGYDIGMSQKYKKTIDNAINGAIDLYLDIYIIFLDILEIFSNIEKK